MIKGSGCDILSISRFKNVLEATPALLKRCFSEREIDEYHKRNDIAYLASRFAAKEAIVKSFTKYNHDLNSIEILNDDDGKPYVVIHSKIKPEIFVSISYETEYVMAYAVLSSIL